MYTTYNATREPASKTFEWYDNLVALFTGHIARSPPVIPENPPWNSWRDDAAIPRGVSSSQPWLTGNINLHFSPFYRTFAVTRGFGPARDGLDKTGCAEVAGPLLPMEVSVRMRVESRERCKPSNYHVCRSAVTEKV